MDLVEREHKDLLSAIALWMTDVRWEKQVQALTLILVLILFFSTSVFQVSSSMTIENPCYISLPLESLGEPLTSQELRRSLEKGDENEKIDTMKKVIIMMANGDPCHDLLMFVIRFVMPVPKNKMIKKLLLIYFELCHKLGPDGKLKQEMILVW